MSSFDALGSIATSCSEQRTKSLIFSVDKRVYHNSLYHSWHQIFLLWMVSIEAKLWVCTKSDYATPQFNCKTEVGSNGTGLGPWTMNEFPIRAISRIIGKLQRTNFDKFLSSNPNYSFGYQLHLFKEIYNVSKCIKEREQKHRLGSVSVSVLWNKLFHTVNNSSRIQVRPERKKLYQKLA